MTCKRRLMPGILQVVSLYLILIAGMPHIGCIEPPGNDVLNQADETWKEIIPEQGTETTSTEPPGNDVLNKADEIWREIIPEQGTETTYRIPLSLDNTQQFIDWFNSIELSADEQLLWNAALSSLVAPCCDDYPMSEC